MCGRFTLHAAPSDVAQHFGLDEVPDLPERYNIAPTQPVATVRLDAGHHVLTTPRWGLIPSWSKDSKIAYSLINARAETVATKPAFRAAFKARRCLVPVDGFFEWASAGTKHKQPYHFRRLDGGLFAFAGLWECWQNQDGESVETCAIITTTANQVVRPVHERMPVILDPAEYGQWLNPRAETDELQTLLRPFPEKELTTFPVSSFVSNARNQGPQCLQATSLVP